MTTAGMQVFGIFIAGIYGWIFVAVGACGHLRQMQSASVQHHNWQSVYRARACFIIYGRVYSIMNRIEKCNSKSIRRS